MFSPNFFTTLASLYSTSHAHSSSLYQLIDCLVKDSIAHSGFSSKDNTPVCFGEYKQLIFPYYSFGNIDSLALFGLDELLLFSFYYSNRARYTRALDIGGNIGLHSILMSKLGWQVTAFEPDPIHYDVLQSNLLTNDCHDVKVVMKAVYDESKTFTFVRVEGNTTGSHLQGIKNKPYGDVTQFTVDSVDIRTIIDGIDFIKLDAEGAEANILTSIPLHNYDKLDVMAEISTPLNAQTIFSWLTTSTPVNAFSQKNNWRQVTQLTDLPTSHKEGSVFITTKDHVPFD